LKSKKVSAFRVDAFLFPKDKKPFNIEKENIAKNIIEK